MTVVIITYSCIHTVSRDVYNMCYIRLCYKYYQYYGAIFLLYMYWYLFIQKLWFLD